MKREIQTNNAPKAIGAYSQAILINDMVFISGQIPINPETSEVELGIENQTHRVMSNLKAILESEDLTFKNVIKSSIFIKDMNQFSIINKIYASYFNEKPYPARETVEVSKLPKDVSIEISMIAHK